MQKVAVFGKPGGGKSTLSKRLHRMTGLPLCLLDNIEYEVNGQKVDKDIFSRRHEEVLSKDAWIIDGLGPLTLFKQRVDVADTLIYIDLPYWLGYWWVTKRWLKSVLEHPAGWPEGCSVWKGTLQSYKVLRMSPGFWNPDFEDSLHQLAQDKTVFIIKTLSDLRAFEQKMKKKYGH